MDKLVKRLALITITIILTGCGTYFYHTKSPGGGISESFALRYGCSYTEVMTQAEKYKPIYKSGRVHIPYVGMDVCELMAKNGRPDDSTVHSSAYGKGATWWYGTGAYDSLWMITLNRENGSWVVSSVTR